MPKKPFELPFHSHSRPTRLLKQRSPLLRPFPSWHGLSPFFIVRAWFLRLSCASRVAFSDILYLLFVVGMVKPVLILDLFDSSVVCMTIRSSFLDISFGVD